MNEIKEKEGLIETETKKAFTIKDLIILILIVFAICIFFYFILTYYSLLDVISYIIAIPLGLAICIPFFINFYHG
jgi:hypothetical protein